VKHPLPQTGLCCVCLLLAGASCPAAWRDDALELVRRSTDAVGEKQIGVLDRQGAVSRYSVWYAYNEYFLHLRDGAAGRRERALKVCEAVMERVLSDDAELHRDQASQLQSAVAELVQMRRWMIEDGSVDARWLKRFDEALAVATDHMLEHVPERETMNRASYGGASCQAMVTEFPDHPHAPAWREYADAVWGEFTSQWDTIEDASGYNALCMATIMALARERGAEDDLRGPQVRALLDRWAGQVTPAGTIPHYGDGYFHSPLAMWTAAFARAATLTGDGRYERLAREMFEFQQSQFEGQLPSDPSHMHWLAWACSEPGPAEVAPEFASALNTRRDRYGRELLDKLILRDRRPHEAGWPTCFAMVNLHELGYHAHSDAGAVVSLVRGSTIHLHELGYHQDQDRYHNTLLVLPPEARFPEREREFVAGRWNHAALDLRKPFTYCGREAPDLSKITALFFRLDDDDAVNAEFDLLVDDLRAARGDALAGEEESALLADFEDAEAAEAWTNAEAVAAPGGGHCVRSQVSFANENASERHWVTWTFDEPLDLSGYERLEFRWKLTDNRLDRKIGAQFGLQDNERTQRWRFGSYPTHREVTDCRLFDFERAAYAQVRLRLADRTGAWHRQLRQVALLKPSGALLVRDTLIDGAECELQLGQVWHVEEVVERGDGWFVAHSEVMYPDRDVTWRCVPGDMLVRFFPQGGHSVGATERQIVDRGRNIAQRWILYDHWKGRAQPGEKLSFTCLLLPVEAGQRPEVEILQQEDEMCLVRVGEDLVLLNPEGTPVEAELRGDARFCYVERQGGQVKHCCAEASRLRLGDQVLKAPGASACIEF